MSDYKLAYAPQCHYPRQHQAKAYWSKRALKEEIEARQSCNTTRYVGSWWEPKRAITFHNNPLFSYTCSHIHGQTLSLASMMCSQNWNWKVMYLPCSAQSYMSSDILGTSDTSTTCTLLHIKSQPDFTLQNSFRIWTHTSPMSIASSNENCLRILHVNHSTYPIPECRIDYSPDCSRSTSSCNLDTPSILTQCFQGIIRNWFNSYTIPWSHTLGTFFHKRLDSMDQESKSIYCIASEYMCNPNTLASKWPSIGLAYLEDNKDTSVDTPMRPISKIRIRFNLHHLTWCQVPLQLKIHV